MAYLSCCSVSYRPSNLLLGLFAALLCAASFAFGVAAGQLSSGIGEPAAMLVEVDCGCDCGAPVAIGPPEVILPPIACGGCCCPPFDPAPYQRISREIDEVQRRLDALALKVEELKPPPPVEPPRAVPAPRAEPPRAEQPKGSLPRSCPLSKPAPARSQAAGGP